MKSFYRSIWTCGRYDADSHSAIMYNLLTGYSYFFEEESADVIGYVLNTPRDGNIEQEYIIEELMLDAENLFIFLEKLVQIGLLSGHISNVQTIETERKRLANIRKEKGERQLLPSDKMNTVDAERDFQNRAKTRIFSVVFELTYNCSEKCLHCYNPGASRNDEEKSDRKTQELNLDDYKQAIDQLYELGLVRVCLSGGDPFSKPIIWEIIEYLYSKEIAFDIYTNGQNLKGYESKLASFFPCTVGVSVYSAIADIHDSITRTQGSLHKTLDVIDKLASLSIPLEIKCCIMHQNCKSYRSVLKIADKYSAALQLECNIFDSVDGDECVSKYLRLSAEEMRIVLRDRNLLLYVGPEIINYGARVLPQNENVCGAGYSGFCITPDGTVVLCVSFHTAIGNLKKDSLSTIFSNPKLKWWKNLKISDYEECGKYDYCDFCPLCPGLNFAKNGTPLRASDNNCYIAKIRKEVADLLKEGKDPLGGKSIDEALMSLPDIKIDGIKKIQGISYYKKELGNNDSH